MPRTLENVDVGRPKSKRALEEAQSSDNRVLLLAQRDSKVDDPTGEQLFDIGTLGIVKQVIRLPDNSLQVLIEGRERVEVTAYHAGSSLRARVRTLANKHTKLTTEELRALAVQVKRQFEYYIQNNKNLRLDKYHLDGLRALQDPSPLADVVARYATWPVEDKQKVLAETDVGVRLELVLAYLNRDLERFKLDKQVATRVKQQMDQNQRDYYMREQIKAIQKELGGEESVAETEELRQKIAAKAMPEHAEERALKEVTRLEKMGAASPEATVVRTYLETLLELPWNSETEVDEEFLEVAHTAEILDEDHYALKEPKERILEFLAVRQLTQETQDADYKAPILCLAGPPGVGKTSLAKSIARSLNREFVRMSLGGVRDEAEIRGHRRTYIGSLPGRIIQGMKTAGTLNPVFLLDEIDKMTADFRGDPSSALLEVLDPEQNNTFRDHYLEIDYDLSKVMFITTANSLQTIPRPLLDRMEVIQIPGYTLNEKIEIAKRYRIPRQLKNHGMNERLELSDETIRLIITRYTREAGVRNLDRVLAKVARKSAKNYLDKAWQGLQVVDANEGRELLGVPPFRDDPAEKEAQVGLSHGLAWTSVGGVTLDIEAVALEGKGNVTLTGQLGEVMQESARAALAYLRTRSEEYGIASDFYDKQDVHVHVLEGATPKDGPSAGIAIATAVVSALTKRPARGDVAMTGEITLRGRVLPIGGVKEKLLAAHQAGIHHVIIPAANEANLEDVPEEIMRELNVMLVDSFDTVMDIMLGSQNLHRLSPEENEGQKADDFVLPLLEGDGRPSSISL